MIIHSALQSRIAHKLHRLLASGKRERRPVTRQGKLVITFRSGESQMLWKTADCPRGSPDDRHHIAGYSCFKIKTLSFTDTKLTNAGAVRITPLNPNFLECIQGILACHPAQSTEDWVGGIFPYTMYTMTYEHRRHSQCASLDIGRDSVPFWIVTQPPPPPPHTHTHVGAHSTHLDQPRRLYSQFGRYMCFLSKSKTYIHEG